MEKELRIEKIKEILSDSMKGRKVMGYEKKQIEHVEGDMWEESGKTWTIKNGLKQTITKFDEIRSQIFMPLTCPICNQPMNKRIDKKFWSLKKRCSDCVINEDTKRMIDGTFVDYEKEQVRLNRVNYLNDLKSSLYEYIREYRKSNFMTEAGVEEEWISGMSEEELTKIIDSQINIFEERLKTSE